jgi:dTDP-4-amino-4,6-dideoxygalactose transaminase
MNHIPFNKPYFTGEELNFIAETFKNKKIAGDGDFTKKCHSFFEKKYGFKKVLLTTSCTDALEMAAILLDIKPEDEVIIPSYTFVSTANPFALRGAKIIFADSQKNNPNMDVNAIEKLITPKTKAIIPVHYAGIACNMDEIMALANKHHIYVVEDAAQCIDSYYKEKPIGSIGHLAAFSFHETKNIISGEGGMLVINDPQFIERAEIIREKGTNRSQFFRGEIDKYGWVDVGSSFLPSDMIAAFLYAQCLSLDIIQKKRIEIWSSYYNQLKKLEDKQLLTLPYLPDFASNNGHIFYIVCKDLNERTKLITELKNNNISSVFHYLSLHKSDYYVNKHDGRDLPNADKFTDCLLRLPLFYELEDNSIKKICDVIINFYTSKSK